MRILSKHIHNSCREDALVLMWKKLPEYVTNYYCFNCYQKSGSQENSPSCLPHMVYQKSSTQTKIAILRVPSWPKHLKHLGSESCTTAYLPHRDGMVEHFNRSFLQLLRVYVYVEKQETGNSTCHLFCTCTACQSTHQQKSVHSCLCMEGNQD